MKTQTATSSTRCEDFAKVRLAFFGAFAGLNVAILLYCFAFMSYVTANATINSMDDLYMRQPSLGGFTLKEAKNAALIMFPACSFLVGLLALKSPISFDNWEKITIFNLFAFLPLIIIFGISYVFVPMYR